MPTPRCILSERIAEAERLIDQARTLLHRPEEEIVVNYLEHAVEALRIVSEAPTPPHTRPMVASSLTAAMVPAEDHG